MGANKYPEAVPEKIVIVAGPSFGNAMKFMLLGVAAGAAATYYFTQKQSAEGATYSASARDKDSSSQSALNRVSALASRAKKLASSVRDLAEKASDTIVPAVGDALATARATAKENEERLREDLAKAPERADAKDVM